MTPLELFVEALTANSSLTCGQNNQLCNGSSNYTCNSNSNSCSGNGVCSNGQCQCNSGFYLADCSMDQAGYDRQSAYRQALITLAANEISSIDSNSDFSKLTDLLESIDSLTQDPTLSNNVTLALALSAVNQSLNIMNSSFSSGQNTTSAIQKAADIISNVFTQISVTDCGLSTNFSSEAVNQSYYILDKLSDLSLRDASMNQQQIVQTSSFLVYSVLVAKSQLANLTIAPSDSTPALTITADQDLKGLPSTVAVSYIYLNRNLLNCNSSSPPTNFTLEVKDGKTFQPIKVAASVQVLYPRKYFPDATCPSASSCERSQSSNDDVICGCEDLALFDIKGQLANIYKSSQLYQLNLQNFIALFTHPPYKRWSFWVAIGYSIGLILAWIIINTVNAKFCVIRNIHRKYIRNAKEKKQTTFNWCYKLFIIVVMIHPFSSVFVYVDKEITKSLRALVYYLRVMILLGFSAVFPPNDPQVLFSISGCLIIHSLRFIGLLGTSEFQFPG